MLVVVVDSLVREREREREISVARACNVNKSDVNTRRRTAVDESVLNDCAKRKKKTKNDNFAFSKAKLGAVSLPPFLPFFLAR